MKYINVCLLLIDYRTYGVPTIRTDLPAPRIRRVDDTKNYGDESDAYGLVNPSIYSTYGVSEKDFLKARPKEEVIKKHLLCFFACTDVCKILLNLTSGGNFYKQNYLFL